MASAVVSLSPQGSRNSTLVSPASFPQSPIPSGYSKIPSPPRRGVGHSCGKKHSVCSYATKLSVCVCRCSVFLQTPLLGCYEIKTIFSLSKCFPSKPLEAHNSQPIFNSHFLGDRRKWQLRVLFPPKRPLPAWNKRPARGGSVSMTALINVSFTLNFSNDR